MLRKYISPLMMDRIKKTFLAGLITRKKLIVSTYDLDCEITTRCNLKCRMCSRPLIENLEVGDMDFSLLEKIINDIKKMKVSLSFNPMGLGEPLLYRNLTRLIALVKEELPLTKFVLTTNGTLLDTEHSTQIIQGGVDEIAVSLNVSDSRTYYEMMGVNIYEKVVRNIINFLELRRKLKSRLPRVNIQFMKTKKTSNQIRKFYNFWKGYLSKQDKVFINEVVSHGGAIDTEPYNISQTNFTRRYPCMELWTVIAIRKNGDVYPCCAAFYLKANGHDLLLGNVRQDSLEKIYFSKESKIQKIRRYHLNGEYKNLPTCRGCDTYRLTPNAWFKNRMNPFIKRKWL